MKKVLLFFALLFAGIQFAAAQNLQVSGKVTSADDGLPVIGATIKVEGASAAALSDVNGDYKINVPSTSSKVLVVAYAGMQNGRATVVSNGEVINFSLKADALSIENVVVTAYGSTAKKAFTGSAAVVKSSEIKGQAVSTVSQALQGLASGVMVVNGSGQPGTDAVIRVRGIGSFTGGNAPLIVLDGVAYNNGLNTINPQDIDNITILKDASSTSLYGPRAANGVIMVTTKAGRDGKTTITANASYGFSDRAVDIYNFIGAAQHMDLSRQSIYNDVIEGGYNVATALGESIDNIVDYTTYSPYKKNGKALATPFDRNGKLIAGAELAYDQNWNDELFRIGQRQEYDVQVQGGTDKNRYMFSVGYLNDQGIVKTSQFERFTGRAKVDAQITSWLKMGINAGLTYNKSNVPMQNGTNTSSSTGWLLNTANIFPAYLLNGDGTFKLDRDGQKQYDFGYKNGNAQGYAASDFAFANRGVGSGSNPAATTALNNRDTYNFLSSNMAYAEAFYKGFSLKTTFGVDYRIEGATTYNNPFYGDGAAYKGLSERQRNTQSVITNITTLGYDNIFGKHHVAAIVGMDTYDLQYDYLTAAATGFDFWEQELDYGSTPNTTSSGRYRTLNTSYIARVNYDFDDRLHFQASYSYAGTSRFTEKMRWGGFYSFGAAWNISNEKWFAPVAGWFNNLKLRASYGTSGNQDIGLAPYQTFYVAGANILGNSGSIYDQLGNPNLTWERQGMLDVGVDMSFLGGNINASVTYYSKESEGLLMARPKAISSGVSSYFDNIGKSRNQGVEIDFSAVAFNRKNFQWNIGFNIAYLQSEVLALPEDVRGPGVNNGGYKQLFEGSSPYGWYLREWAGVDSETGTSTWWQYEKDAKGNETGKRKKTSSYSSATQRIVGESIPKWQGGINTSFRFYGVEISAVASFAIGGKVLDMDKAGLMDPYTSMFMNRQHSTDILNHWQKPGDVTDVPYLMLDTYSGTARGAANGSYTNPSTRWLVDGSYLRLRNLTVAYDFASIVGVKKIGLNKLRLYFSGENLLTIFGAEGLDPEQTIGGITDARSSALKTFSFGINIGF